VCRNDDDCDGWLVSAIFVPTKSVYSCQSSWAPRVTHYNVSECDRKPRERREIVDKNGQEESIV